MPLGPSAPDRQVDDVDRVYCTFSITLPAARGSLLYHSLQRHAPVCATLGAGLSEACYHALTALICQVGRGAALGL